MAFHYARVTKDYEASDVDGPEVFHFVAVEGDNDWVEVQLQEPIKPEHEGLIRHMVEEHLSEDYDPDTGTWAAPLRITRRFLRRQGADFVTVGEGEL